MCAVLYIRCSMICVKAIVGMIEVWVKQCLDHIKIICGGACMSSPISRWLMLAVVYNFNSCSAFWFTVGQWLRHNGDLQDT